MALEFEENQRENRNHTIIFAKYHTLFLFSQYKGNSSIHFINEIINIFVGKTKISAAILQKTQFQ